MSVIIIVSLTIIFGALVAGMKAGLLYNTFPLMGGQWIPEDAFSLQPFYENFFKNPSTVQWTHRVLALSSLAAIWIFIWICSRKKTGAALRPWLQALGLCSLLQVFLGILTLLYQVPLILAVSHQGGAVIVLAILLVILHQSVDAREQLTLQKFQKSPAAS